MSMPASAAASHTARFHVLAVSYVSAMISKMGSKPGGLGHILRKKHNNYQVQAHT